MTLFGKTAKPVEKTDYQIGYSGTAEEVAAGLYKSPIQSGYGGIFPNEILNGAIRALQEGRNEAFITTLQHEVIIAPELVVAAVANGVEPARLRSALDEYNSDRTQSILDHCVHVIIDGKMKMDEKLAALQVVTDAGGNVSINKDAALVKAIFSVQQPVIDFLQSKGASVDNALAGAEEAKSGPHVAAVKAYKLGPENAALMAEIEDLKKQYFDKVGEQPKPYVAPKNTGHANTGA